jgi:hypothetical protein
MYEAQRYPDKELVILEDSGVFGDATIRDRTSHWTLISTTTRYPSVGTKRNVLATMTDAPLLAVADDDDWYLPWHLEAAVEALRDRCWARPTQALEWDAPDRLGRYYTHASWALERFAAGTAAARESLDCCYGAQWSYRRAEFLQSGGYPERHGNGDDTEWARIMYRHAGHSSDPISARYPRPSYVYSRDHSHSWHASALGNGTAGLKALQAMPRRSVDEFVIRLPPGYNTTEIPELIQARKW